MNPYVIIAALFLVVSSFFYGRHVGELAESVKTQQAVIEQQTKAIDQQKVLEKKLNDSELKLTEVQKNANIKIAKLMANIDNGSVRFSIPAAAVSNASTTESHAGTKERCDIDPEAAKSLISIIADGDEAIAQLNALIDFYNGAKDVK